MESLKSATAFLFQRVVQGTMLFSLEAEENVTLSRSSEKKSFSCRYVGFLSDDRVLVYEDPCPSLKKRRDQAVAEKKAINWHFMWIKNGTIFARKSEDALVRISCVSDFGKLQ